MHAIYKNWISYLNLNLQTYRKKYNRNRAFFADQAVYCNGVKCAAYEKCQYDRNARREKCLRA